MSIRPQAVQNAVSFLTDPKVRSSSLTSRISFLESKGLTMDEIQMALSQATSIPTGNGTLPNIQQEKDWKDVLTALTVAGGTGVGIYALAKRYLSPLMSNLGQEQIEKEKVQLETQFQVANEAMEALKQETTQLLSKMDSQSQTVGEALEKLEKTIQEIRELDEKRQEEITKLRDDMENIKNLIPKMVEKNKESQNSVLQELQGEIKSLKSLLMNRKVVGEEGGSRGTSPTLPIPAQPKIPAWQMQDD